EAPVSDEPPDHRQRDAVVGKGERATLRFGKTGQLTGASRRPSFRAARYRPSPAMIVPSLSTSSGYRQVNELERPRGRRPACRPPGTLFIAAIASHRK
ncbi:hypothetical protein, partial [Bradyrhizobium japonicum]|uniref:hypothetical protein n=1 Tax=Bradyrhizobium japonicum TaxID=375 RepID=UPI001AEBEBAC